MEDTESDGEGWRGDVEDDIRKLEIDTWKTKAKDTSIWKRIVEETNALHGL